MQGYQLSVGLISIYPHRDFKDHAASLWVTLINMSSFSDVLGFLDQGSYKSVATQISQGAGLVPVHPTGDQTGTSAWIVMALPLRQSIRISYKAKFVSKN